MVSTSEIKKFPLTPRLNWFHPIQLICHLALFRETLSEDGDDVEIYPMYNSLEVIV